MAAAMSLLGIAKLEVSVGVDVAGHGVDDTEGTGTANGGLRPGALAADGIVPSLKSGVATVLDGGSIGVAPLSKELASVEASALVVGRGASVAVVVVGLHVPVIVDEPNSDVIGSGATDGVETMEEVESIESGEAMAGDDEDINPVVTVALLAVAIAELVMSVVGHMVIAPSEVPGIGPTLPRLS